MSRAGVLSALVLVSAWATAVAEVKVTGRVVHAGFPGGGGADYYRPGTWCPVVVSLQNAGTEHVPGRLVLRQRDKDGDVMVAETLVTLTAGGQARPYRLEFVANQPGRAGRFEVSLLHAETGQPLPVYDDQGQPRQALPAPRAVALSERTTLVLDISSRPISRLDVLADNSGELLKQTMVVARFRLEDLPDRWYALQAVQAIIWNRPDVTRLDPQQMQALTDYVRAGGILVVAAGRTATDLAGSPLGQILPVTVNGTASADVLGRVWEDLLRTRSWGDRPPPQYVPPITVARAWAKPSATVICPEDGLGIHAVTRQRWGSGIVVFVAAELRDLFQVHAESPKFFKEVLGLLSKPPKVDRSPAWPQHQDLYDYMHGIIIGFEAVSMLLLVFVVLFVAGYILLATLATWGWLRRKRALQHCWIAFAVVASASSVLSIAAVQGLLGVGTDLRQMCVVDVSVPLDNAGPLQAQAVAYFGLRTSTHTRLDVRLASARSESGLGTHRSYLHPLPTSRARMARGYVAPERYYLRAGQAIMEAVPIRATLKRLQGYWFGELEGSFSALIEVDTSFMVDVRGWVRNDLGVDLHDCWLIVAKTDRMGGDARDQQIFAYQIARTLRTGGGRYPIGSDIDPSVAQTDWLGLKEMQTRWAGRFMMGGPGGPRGRQEPKFEMDKFPTALMLLTTMDEYDETAAGQHRLELARTHGLHLDRCHLLTEDMAMMVGFADSPGPVRLDVRPGGQEGARWRPIAPEFGHTMFRLFIPVRRMALRREATW